MATPNNLYDNQIVLRIGGMEHRTWQSYDIDSDFLIPADGFDFELGVAATQGQIPDLTGQRCEVVTAKRCSQALSATSAMRKIRAAAACA